MKKGGNPTEEGILFLVCVCEPQVYLLVLGTHCLTLYRNVRQGGYIYKYINIAGEQSLSRLQRQVCHVVGIFIFFACILFLFVGQRTEYQLLDYFCIGYFCGAADIVFGLCLLFVSSDCITGRPLMRILRQVRAQISSLERLSNENVAFVLCFWMSSCHNGIEWANWLQEHQVNFRAYPLGLKSNQTQ